MLLLTIGVICIVLAVLGLAFRLFFWVLKGALWIGLFGVGGWLIVRGITSVREHRR